MRSSKLISIVIPEHNEEENVVAIYSEIRTHVAEYPAEIIFVDDGSRDSTAGKVRSLQALDPFVRLLRLTRNFSWHSGCEGGGGHHDGL